MSHLVAFVYPNHPQQEQTAEVAETEPMSGEIVASMNEQQEITIKDLQKSMQMGVEQVSKLPEHLGPMLQGMRDLKGALPHPDRIQDEKTRQHFQAAHDELRETRDKLVSKVALLQTQGGTCRGMIISLQTLIQKLYRTCLSPSSQMIKFDPAAFRDEISQVRSFSQQMAEHFAGWGQARTACAATSALTKIEVLIPAANANAMVSSSDEALQKYTKAEADIQYLVAKRYQQQYVLDASRAQLEDIKKNRSAEEEAVEDLEKRMEELNKQTALLEEARKGEFDHLRKECDELKTDLAKWQTEMEKQKKDDVEQKKEERKKKMQEFDKYQNECEQSLFATRASVYGNHLIVLIDMSWSMSCSGRWPATLTAFDALKAARGPEGANDTMSLVLFNHIARVEFSNEPLTAGNTTLSATPSGGTCYAQAWLEAKKVAQLTSEAHRPIIIMMTDGETSESDVAAAAATAQEVRNLHSGLITFAIALGQDVKKGKLEPIVKAGNGGNDIHCFGNQKVPLLAQATTRTLPKTFRKIASTVSMKEYEMKRQLQLLEEQRSDQQKQMEQSLEDLNKTHKILNDSAVESSRVLQEAKEQDSIKRQEIIDRQISHCEDCRRHLLEKIKQKKQTIMVLRGQEVAYEKDSIPKLEEQLQATEQNYEDSKEALKSLQKSTGSGQLQKIAAERERLLKQVGTNSDSEMASLLQNVQKYIGMRDADRVQTCATESFAGNLKCFTHTLANVLEDPCHAQKTPYVCKYDYIMEHYLKELGVPVKVPMNSSSNFKKVLQYHWSQMVVGSTEGTQVDPKTLELIVKKVDPLELCELLDADPRQETEALNIFGKSMEQELMNSTAGFRKCVAKIDKEKQKKNHLEEKLERLEEKIRLSKDKHDSAASSGDLLDLEQVEKQEKALEDLEGKLEELTDKVDEVASTIKTLEEEKKEALCEDGRLPIAKDLLKHTLRGLQKAYHYRMSMWQKHCLMVHFESMKNVVEQMQQCIQVAEQGNAVLSEHAMLHQTAAVAPNPQLRVLTDYRVGELEPEMID